MPATPTDRIEGLTTSVAVKAPCRVASKTNISLFGQQTIDGVSVVTGDRVLVMGQTNQKMNGIWTVDTSNWTRALDFDGPRDAVYGTLVVVAIDGTEQGNIYTLTAQNPVVIGTSNITFVTAGASAAVYVSQAVAAAAAAQTSQNAAGASATLAGQNKMDAVTARQAAETARDAAIAAVGATKVTVNDTTAAVLNSKVLTTTSLTKVVTNPGGNESLTIGLSVASPTVLGGQFAANPAALAARSAGFSVTADQIGRQTPFIVSANQAGTADAGSFVITSDGKLLYTGSGAAGLQGIGTGDVQVHGFNEVVFPVDYDYKVLQFVGSWQYAHALLDNGEVYGWGTTYTGVIGAANQFVPVKIAFPEAIKSIWCNGNTGAYYHNYAILVAAARDTNNVYGMGYNMQSQATGGNGVTAQQNAPALWPQQYEAVFPFCDGYGGMYARDSDKKLWVWGNGIANTLGNQSANTTTTIYANRVQCINLPQTAGEFVVDVQSKNSDDTAVNGEQAQPVHIALTNLGSVWVWGFSGATQGFGFSGTTAPGQNGSWVPAPQKLLSAGDTIIGGRMPAKVFVIAAYTNRGFAMITTDKTLYTWGFVDSTSTPIGQGVTGAGAAGGVRQPAIPVPAVGGANTFIGSVEQIITPQSNSNGGEWMAVRLTDGRVFACGYNTQGNFGTGDTVTTNGVFVQVPVSRNKKIVHLFLSSFGDIGSIGMVDDKGQVWTCGNNNLGAKGQTNPQNVALLRHRRALVI